MTNVSKLLLAFVGVMIIGFLMVGTNKQQNTEQMQASAQLSTYAALSKMASRKCPTAIKNKTGQSVFFASNTDTDKNTYVTLTWNNTEKDKKFNTAVCTVTLQQGGISKLVIDDEVVIERNKQF